MKIINMNFIPEKVILNRDKYFRIFNKIQKKVIFIFIVP